MRVEVIGRTGATVFASPAVSAAMVAKLPFGLFGGDTVDVAEVRMGGTRSPEWIRLAPHVMLRLAAHHGHDVELSSESGVPEGWCLLRSRGLRRSFVRFAPVPAARASGAVFSNNLGNAVRNVGGVFFCGAGTQAQNQVGVPVLASRCGPRAPCSSCRRFTPPRNRAGLLLVPPRSPASQHPGSDPFGRSTTSLLAPQIKSVHCGRLLRASSFAALGTCGGAGDPNTRFQVSLICCTAVPRIVLLIGAYLYVVHCMFHCFLCAAHCAHLGVIRYIIVDGWCCFGGSQNPSRAMK
jgi:hypothetical protein